MFWCAAPLEIALLWLSYLACHEKVGNLTLSALTLLSIFIAGLAYGAARAAARGETLFAIMKPATALTFFMLLAILGVVMVRVSMSSAMGADIGIAAANFENREVSARPEKWDEKNPMEVRGAKLALANLAHAHAKLAFLAHADLRRADLTSGDFKESDLRGAILQGAVLVGANFEKARLGNATLEGATFLQKEQEDSACSPGDKSPDHFQLFPRADLTEARFSKRARVCHVSFHGATLTGTYLDEVKLPHADLGEAVLKETHLSGAILAFADLQFAQLVQADLRNSNLEGADLTGAKVDCPMPTGPIWKAQLLSRPIEADAYRQEYDIRLPSACEVQMQVMRRIVGLQVLALIASTNVMAEPAKIARILPRGRASIVEVVDSYGYMNQVKESPESLRWGTR